MKRIISAVLAVLICVLTLGGCEKTPTVQESSSESSFAENSEASVSSEAESSKSEDSEQEENFDYTGWQDITLDSAGFEYILTHNNGTTFGKYIHKSKDITLNFKLPSDFKTGYDVYGCEFLMGDKFDVYIGNATEFYIIADEENYTELEYCLMCWPEREFIPVDNGYIEPEDFSEPWYDYLVVKEARGDPDWMCAYHYDIRIAISGGVLWFVVNEYGAFDENYDTSNAVAFINQVLSSLTVTVGDYQ